MKKKKREKLQAIDMTKTLNTTPSNKPCRVIILLLVEKSNRSVVVPLICSHVPHTQEMRTPTPVPSGGSHAPSSPLLSTTESQ